MRRDRKRCEAFVRSYGGQVVYAPMLPGFSTTEILRRIRAGEPLPELPRELIPEVLR